MDSNCSLNSFQHTDALSRLCRRPLLKTFWQKEKWLSMSNFSFCKKCFQLYAIALITLSFLVIFKKKLNSFQSRLHPSSCMRERFGQKQQSSTEFNFLYEPNNKWATSNVKNRHLELSTSKSKDEIVPLSILIMMFALYLLKLSRNI